MKYRPQRFGGPGEGGIKIPDNWKAHDELKFRPADEVAKLCLQAVKNNRPMVISDGNMRKTFQEGYLEIVMGAFDDVDAFDRELQKG